MGLSFAFGTVNWLAADAATTTYTVTCTDVVTGLTFQPKAMRFYCQGLGGTVDANSQSAHLRRSVGFATSTTDRCCVAGQDQDAAGTQVCTNGNSTAACLMTVTSTPAADGFLDINAINSDGFQLIVDDATPVDLAVFWEAWGGDAITAATTGNLAEPAVTGNQSYTVNGQFKPSVLMLAGGQHNALDAVTRQDSGLCVGFASSPDGLDSTLRISKQVVIAGNSDDASTTSDTDNYCQTGECISMIVVAGGNATARAKLISFDQAGFTLNWIARAASNRRYFYLAIQGGQWAAGSYTIAGNSGGATATIDGLPFAPIGVLLIGTMTTQTTAGSTFVQDRMGLGCGVSPTSRQSMGGLSQDAQTVAALINLTMQYDQVLCFPNTSGGVLAAYDINAMNKDGFQIIVDTAGGVSTEWQGYLAFGGKGPVRLNNYLQPHCIGGSLSVSEVVR